MLVKNNENENKIQKKYSEFMNLECDFYPVDYCTLFKQKVNKQFFLYKCDIYPQEMTKNTRQ